MCQVAPLCTSLGPPGIGKSVSLLPALVRGLVRGKAGRIIGGLNALMITMKGLPLTYSKDMQEDKEPTFDALINLSLVIAAMAGMVRDLTPDTKRMKAGPARDMRRRPILPTGWCARRRCHFAKRIM